MTSAPITPPPGDGLETSEPGDRWEWIYASMWLFFLSFPVVGAVTLDRPVWVRAATLAAIAAFAAVYMAGFVRAARHPETAARPAARVLAIALLGLLWGAATLTLGPGALGMLIFVVAYAAFLGSRRLLAATLACVLVATAAVGILGDREDGTWFLAPLVVLLSAAMVGIRVLEERQEDRRDLLEQLTLVAERDRVARDVHDVLGHTLTVVTTKAELAERLVERDPARAVEELQQIRALSREALAEIRATVAGLRVARLEEELASARVALSAAGIEAVVPEDPSVVDPRHRLVLAWVLREAVTNVVRHSAASRCEVVLEEHALTVHDDGRGLDGSVPGMGLGGVQERARAAGATLCLDAPDGGGSGTRLRVAWA